MHPQRSPSPASVLHDDADRRPQGRHAAGHTYNLVDVPIVIAGKSGTAEFGVRDAQGRLPFHDWFVGFVPKDLQRRASPSPTRSWPWSAFIQDANTVGNTATEMVKYFLQMHFGIKKDLRLLRPAEDGQLLRRLSELIGVPDERSMGVLSAERPGPGLGHALGRRRLAHLRLAARDLRRCCWPAFGLAMAYSNSVATGVACSTGLDTSCAASIWPAIAIVVFIVAAASSTTSGCKTFAWPIYFVNLGLLAAHAS